MEAVKIGHIRALSENCNEARGAATEEKKVAEEHGSSAAMMEDLTNKNAGLKHVVEHLQAQVREQQLRIKFLEQMVPIHE